jgi:hypothetical protein
LILSSQLEAPPEEIVAMADQLYKPTRLLADVAEQLAQKLRRHDERLCPAAAADNGLLRYR